MCPWSLTFSIIVAKYLFGANLLGLDTKFGVYVDQMVIHIILPYTLEKERILQVAEVVALSMKK